MRTGRQNALRLLVSDCRTKQILRFAPSDADNCSDCITRVVNYADLGTRLRANVPFASEPSLGAALCGRCGTLRRAQA